MIYHSLFVKNGRRFYVKCYEVMDAIRDLKDRLDVQYLENLSFITEEQHGWNESTTKDIPNLAVEHGFLKAIKRTRNISNCIKSIAEVENTVKSFSNTLSDEQHLDARKKVKETKPIYFGASYFSIGSS